MGTGGTFKGGKWERGFKYCLKLPPPMCLGSRRPCPGILYQSRQSASGPVHSDSALGRTAGLKSNSCLESVDVRTPTKCHLLTRWQRT